MTSSAFNWVALLAGLGIVVAVALLVWAMRRPQQGEAARSPFDAHAGAFGGAPAAAESARDAAPLPPAEAATRFRQAFEPLQRTVYTEGTVFSGSQMSQELDALEPLALQAGEQSAELADLRWLQSEVWRRRGEYPAQALQAGEQSFAIDMATHRLAPATQLERLYWLGVTAEAAGQWETALTHLRAAQQLIETGQGRPDVWTPSRKLGLRERIGYALHEAGHYIQALTHNQQLLQDARQTLGADNPHLRSVLNNLAQNAYDLRDLPQAEQWLHERLRIASLPHNAAAEAGTAFDTLFQLGVIAHEQGHAEAAQTWFQQRLALARHLNDADLIQQAEGDLAELAQRTRAASPAP